MASRRQKIFEELGLLGEPIPTNPFEALGLEPDFARELLHTDPSGDAVRVITGGLHRALSQLYHPDKPTAIADRERFERVDEADRLIKDADLAALTRWARTERTSSSNEARKLQAARDKLVDHMGNFIQVELEGGHNPHHFSQLGRTQGLLVQRDVSTLLMRQRQGGGMQVLRGDSLKLAGKQISSGQSSAFDFQAFLRHHKSFGLEPESKILAFIDEQGRASILAPDLTFLMDITNPVASHRDRLQYSDRTGIQDLGKSDQWMYSSDPLLFVTSVPDPANPRSIGTELTVFPNKGYSGTVTFSDGRGNVRSPGPNSMRSMIWDIPMDVAGSIKDPDFLKRSRHIKPAGAAAIAASTSEQSVMYFNLLATQPQNLITQKAGYSPLMTAGNALLLYDRANRLPVLTDARIIGMIGTNSQST